MRVGHLSVREISAIPDYQVESSSLGPFMTILELVNEISGAHSASINLVDAQRQKMLTAFNCAISSGNEFLRMDSMCATTIDQGQPLIIRNRRHNVRVRDDLSVSGKDNSQFFASFPISISTGVVVGMLCTFGGELRELAKHQQRRIADLAVLIGSLLDLHLLKAQKSRNMAFLSAQSAVLQDSLQGKDLDLLVADLLLAGERFYGAVRLAVKEIDATGKHLRWLCGPSLSDVFVKVQHLIASDLVSTSCGHAALNLTVTEVSDISTFPMNERYRQALIDEDICSIISVPLLAADAALLGVWTLYLPHVQIDHIANNEFISLFGPLLSSLIERTYIARNLTRSELQLNEAQEIAQIGSYSIDLETGIRTYSAVTGKIYGLSSKTFSISFEEYHRLIHPHDVERLTKEVFSLLKAGNRLVTQHRILRENDGALRWVEVASDLIVNGHGKPVRRTGTVTDITEHHGTQELLTLNQQVVELSNVGIIIVDACKENSPIIYINAAAETMSGYKREEIQGLNCRMLHGRFTSQHSLVSIRDGIREQREAHAVVRNMHRSGSEYWIDLRIMPVKNSFGEVTHFIGFQYDLTDRIRYERELIHQAGHDTLTGLVNRSLLIDRLEQLIARSTEGQTLVALVFLDLDTFKLINDSLGHFAGDNLLKQCAVRLTAAAPAGSTIARMGGDEFVLLLETAGDAVHAKSVTDSILHALHLPFVLDGHSVVVSSSAGIAMFPAHGSTATDLLRHADIAMYRAKSNGRARSQMFETSWSVIESQKLTLKEEIAAGIEQNQFCLHYQPKIDASSLVLVGFEALVRWNHPRHGLLYPDRFIDAAEEFGLIIALGTWVLQEACRQSRSWRNAGRYHVPVAVNVSASQFRDEHFVERIQKSLRDCALEASALELEVTESVVMENPEQFIGVLKELHTLGVMIAVDDFGTGYSSLSFIKRFPIDVLKIDRSFVRDICTDPSDAAICQTIIVMAHNLGLKVVAEGVETAEQAFFLLEYKCDVFQGYLYSKPMPPDANFEAFIADKSSSLAAHVEVSK